MHVTCQTIDDFLANLEAEGTTFRGIVYTSRTREPLGENKRNAVRFMVSFFVSTVVDMGEDGQYLLDTAEECGIDYEDASQEKVGSLKAESLRSKVRCWCESHGLNLRPGVVDF